MKHIQLIILLLFCCWSNGQTNDQVFYSSFRPQGWNIHISKDNGQSFYPFTKNSSLDYDAKISPNGKWVVFTSERLGKPHLFIKHIEGDTLPRLLVKSNSMQDQIDFSPDGNWIAFVSSHEGNAEIYKLPFKPLDTLSVDNAINLTHNSAGDFRPRFSHDGQSIAFSSDRSHDIKPHKFLVFAMQRTGEIYTMSSNGQNVKRLTNSEGWDGSPNWSEDDSKIIFYSNKSESNGKPDLYQIDVDGENENIITPEGLNGAMSPLVINNERILLTNRDIKKNRFRILEINPITKTIDSSLSKSITMDMMNVDYHKSGIIVYHGGKELKETEGNKGDFFGDVLVKNHPASDRIENKDVALFGIRRSFASPPVPNDTKIVYSYNPARGFGDFVTPFLYPIILLPVLALIWFIVGIVRSIKKRREIKFWKHLIFSVLSVLLITIILILLYNWVGMFVLPMSTVKLYIGLILLVVLIALILMYKIYKKQKSANKPMASLYKLYSMMFLGYAIGLLYITLFVSSFLSSTTTFYMVDYNTNEVEKLFDFKADKDFNPQSCRIIDTKFTPDGSALQFSAGSFRGNPKAQGAVYTYHLKNETLEKITPLNANYGFADFSADNNTMVYRSGASGNMDIYIKENGTITNLTHSEAKENFPVISPDGNKIVYCSDSHGKNVKDIVKTMDIFLIERQDDGSWSAPKQMTSYSGQEGHPHFSPDGKWIIYSTEEFGINDEQPIVQSYIFAPQMYGEIVAIRISDKKKVRLTHNKWEEGAPLWIESKK
ncbi:hypothetical protein [Psychroserpens algicola]|uniref:DUF5050 domain-containing protein n=1 Tax=Psychroserpens algicola TaxID=1719034 RepID=A0ABT0HB74_9FLAO|nr:hypothetical protein [Psychroserpens algicola]MCK8481608.1 hypothetical protein [Psychroserpens algicola]